MRTRHFQAISLVLVLATQLSGCGGMAVSEKSGRIKLATEPAGATAYANGVELGATPLTITPGDHFPAGFVGLSYRYHGKLSFKKDGCEAYSVEVNDKLLAGDIQARLKCDPDYRPPVTAKPQATAADEKFADRLDRIDGLRKKGLISDEEYRNLRKRILDEL